MGLLGRLFAKDPAKLLDRAEALLGRGNAYGARQLVREAREAADGAQADEGLAGRAAALELRCRGALAESALEEARFAEEEGDFADAAEWVASALEHVGEERRGELRKRRRGLLARAEEAERERRRPVMLDASPAGAGTGGGADEEDEGETGPDTLETEVRFGTLVGTLRDEVADRYLHRPTPFQSAYVDLNEGRVEEALEGFDALAEASPDDPVVRLERGRCRLLLGDPTGAREDFEAAWPELGSDPLDSSGASVASLWAEACLEPGEGRDPEAVVERLADLADLSSGAGAPDDPELAALYGRALLAADRADDAVEHLVEAAERFRGRQELPHLLARALVASGGAEERGRAIRVLETAIAPSCASGTCSKPPLHGPSVRTLIGLYLDRIQDRIGDRVGDRIGDSSDEPVEERPEGRPDRAVEAAVGRVEELFSLLAREQEGRATLPDLRLLARFLRVTGDPEEAERLEAEAERLEGGASTLPFSSVDTTGPVSVPGPGRAGSKPVL